MRITRRYGDESFGASLVASHGSVIRQVTYAVLALLLDGERWAV
jgi:hypothetical protein